jgi:hypothetical protein
MLYFFRDKFEPTLNVLQKYSINLHLLNLHANGLCLLFPQKYYFLNNHFDPEIKFQPDTYLQGISCLYVCMYVDEWGSGDRISGDRK